MTLDWDSAQRGDSKWLHAADLKDGARKEPWVVTCKHIGPEKYLDKDGKECTSLVLHLEDADDLFLGLNKTNRCWIEANIGNPQGNLDVTVGHVIELFTVPTQKGDGIRMRKSDGKPPSPSPF